MLDNINKLFEYFPNEDNLKISIHKNGDSDKKHHYYVYVMSEDGFIEHRYMWGYTTVDYTDGFDEKTKYTCDKLSENKFENISNEDAMQIIKLGFLIIYHTDTVDGCSIKITKKEKDFKLDIPELVHKYYWATDYFYKENDEEENEEE